MVGSDLTERFHGTPGDDVVVAGGGDDEIFGKGGNDTICAGSGVDVLWGSAGNDVLLGGSGDDDMIGGKGKDRYSGGSGFDDVDSYDSTAPIQADLNKDTLEISGTIEPIKSVEVIYGSNFDDVIIGDEGENYLFAEGGNDRVLGNGGIDFLAGGPGDDELDGGEGELNSVSYWLSETPVRADLGAGTVTGEGSDTIANFNILRGSSHDDVLVGSERGEHIIAEDGADQVNALGGDDAIYAERGEDTIDGGDGLDTISYFFSARPVQIDLAAKTATEFEEHDAFTSIEAAIGSDYDDTIDGTNGNDIIGGGLGNDILRGLDGDLDILDGGLGDDTIDGGPGFGDVASFSGSPEGVVASLSSGTATGQGNDTLVGLEGLAGSAAKDQLTGDINNNYLTGNLGDDRLDGGGGIDVVYYGSSSEGITVNLAAGSAGGAGSDALASTEGVYGSPSNDTMSGDANGNILIGAEGDDQLSGLAGTDILDGDLGGADSLDGGADSDDCFGGETVTNCETPVPANPLGPAYAAAGTFADGQPRLTSVEARSDEIQIYAKRAHKRAH
ncbi:MAG: hypothetical protein QOG54_2173 [Actinomycetota bacterium]|nr:hypothetical protein [Actinomycetota bacterium]